MTHMKLMTHMTPVTPVTPMTHMTHMTLMTLVTLMKLMTLITLMTLMTLIRSFLVELNLTASELPHPPADLVPVDTCKPLFEWGSGEMNWFPPAV